MNILPLVHFTAIAGRVNRRKAYSHAVGHLTGSAKKWTLCLESVHSANGCHRPLGSDAQYFATLHTLSSSPRLFA